MSTASARVMLGEHPVGTAWRFHERYALTAAHCLGDMHQLRRLPETVHLQFPGERPLAARTRLKEGLDAALLEIVDPVPAGIPMIELAKPPSEPLLSSYEWRGIAYPLVSDFQQLIISGLIRGYVYVDGGQALQISFNDIVNRRVAGGQTLLTYASGAAVTYQERAIGLVRASIEETQVGHAVPIDRVAAAFPEVRERLRDYPVATGGARWRDIDRKDQWTEVAAAIVMPESKTLVLPGDTTQCHKYFVDRLVSFLAGAPQQRGEPIEVEWEEVSWTTPDFVAAISKALDGQDDADEARLAARLQKRAEGAKLVVIHPVLDPEKRADDLDAVVAYYQEVVPRILGTASPDAGRGILCLQPIEWTDAGGKAKAQELIARLARSSWPSVEVLHELTPLAPEDLQRFGAPPAILEKWRQRPTTREAFRLLRDSTTGRSHGP